MENRLNELNIFALRDLARKTGVSSPTSKRKEDLIKEIIEITSGKKQPSIAKTKQGRPPKIFGYDVGSMFEKPFFNTDNAFSFGEEVLNQSEVEYKPSNIITVAGWVELVNNNAGLLWVENGFKLQTYFIPSVVVSKYDIRMGDRVVAEVIGFDNQKSIKEIFSINDNPILKLPKKRLDYLDVQSKIPSRKLRFNENEFSNLNIMNGENVFIYGTNNNENTKQVIKLLNDADVDTKLYVNISVAEKNKMYLSEIKHAENFVADIIDETEKSRRVLMLAIERAKRSMETGEDVLVVVDDMLSVFGVDKDGLLLMKTFASIAKETKKGSITVIAVMPNNGLNQIEKLADKRLAIKNNIIETIS